MNPTTVGARPSTRYPTLRSTIRSEWTKLRTLRSTWIAGVSTVIVMVSFAALSAATRLHDWDQLAPPARGPMDATRTAFAGLVVIVIVFGALGVHHASVEFATGMIRQTFIATPRRPLVIVAKATAVAAVAVPVTLTANVGAFVVSQRILAAKGFDQALTDPSSLFVLGTAALAVGILAALGVGLGALIERTTAGTITFMGIVFGGGLIAGLVPAAIRPGLPDAALQAATTSSGPGELGPTVLGLGVLLAYALVALVLATVAVERRDV
jgi:ABC-2 type transport system permease protein